MSLVVKIEAQYQEFQSATAAMKEMFAGVMEGMRAELRETAQAADDAMKKHVSVFEDMGTLMKAKMHGVTGVIEGVKTAWAQLAVIGAVGGMMVEAAASTSRLAKEAGDLGSKMGVSATEASRLRVALQLNGVSADEFTRATNALNKTILSHEERLTAVGIATRDANGNLRSQVDVTIDAIAKLQEFKEGTDRNIEAQKLFGKGVQLTDEMLALTKEKLKEGADFADAYGLAVGKDGVAASEVFVEATQKVGLIIEGLKNAIGQALLPILDDLTRWLTENGPFAMNVIKIAIAEVSSVFYGLKFAGQALYETLSVVFKNLMEIGGAFGRVMYNVLHGDFGAAAEDAKLAIAAVQANSAVALRNIAADATVTRDKLADLWGGIIDPSAVVDSGKIGGGTQGVEVNKKKAPRGRKGSSSDAAARRAAAEAHKKAQEQYRAVMEGLKGEEQAAQGHYEKLKVIYGKELAEARKMYGEKSQQAQAVINKIEALERKHADDMAKLAERQRETDRMRSQAMIDAEEIEAQARLQLGQITEQQMFDLQRDFEQRRFQLRLASLEDEAALNINKGDQHAATLQKIEQLQLQHSLRMQGIAAQQRVAMSQPMMAMVRSFEQGFAQVMTGLVNRSMSFRDAFNQLGLQMVNQFAQQQATKLARWITTELRMTDATVAGNTTRAGAAVAADQTTQASNIKTGTTSLFASGAAVFGKVYEAIAGIPYVGPFLAPVMAMAAMGAVVGMVGKISSARGGYDIPAGVNPVTQLHEQEMVLPAQYAEVIRSMADSGQGAGGGVVHNTNIQAIDARAFKEFLRRNPGALGYGMANAGHYGFVKR